MNAGMTLPEAMLSVAVLGILASLVMPPAQDSLARQRLEAASRQLGMGLERARARAEERGQPCGLSLGLQGWIAPTDGAGSLPACLGDNNEPLNTGIGIADALKLRHTFPAVLRISSNGLVLDGGTAVLSDSGTSLQRCLVMAPPLGIVRLGRYQGSIDGELNSSACLPDPTL